MQGDLPTIDFEISELIDEEDDVADVTIKCHCPNKITWFVVMLSVVLLVDAVDEPLAAACGFDYKKLQTGFPTGYTFKGRGDC